MTIEEIQKELEQQLRSKYANAGMPHDMIDRKIKDQHLLQPIVDNDYELIIASEHLLKMLNTGNQTDIRKAKKNLETAIKKVRSTE